MGKPVRTIPPSRWRKRPTAQAVSLAETLIVVGLVGLLLLPVLLTSTTYFSGQMLKMRQRLGLAHNISLLLSQMINHFGSTTQLITSTSQETFTAADELHYTFYDPVKATQIYGGFKLTTLGSGRRKLEALTYSSGTWSAISPYRTSPATAYTVPGAAVFDYCNPDACGKTPDQATYVRLNGWTFRDEAAPARTFALPTTDIYLNSRRATEGKLTGQRARLLYSTTPTQAFGATGNLEVLSLSPARKTLWMFPASIAPGSIAPGLITIADGALGPGDYSTMVDETRGNVFLFEALGNLYHWNSLMTTAALRQSSGAAYDGWDASIVSPYTGRVYFGCNFGSSCGLRYYDPATNTFSTVSAANKINFGGDALVADPGRKVIYAGWRASSNDTGILMYNEDTGTTTTLLTMTSGANNDIRETLSLNPTTGRLYFAFRKSAGPLWSWTPTSSGGNFTSGTLVSIGSGLVTLGRSNSIQALPTANNRVLFADNAGIYTWKDGDGTTVTTIRTGAASTPMRASDYWPAAMRSIHHFNFRYDTSRDIAYWYEAGTNSGVYAYEFGTSTLRTLTPTVGSASGLNSLWLDSNTGKLYWGNSAIGDRNVYEWTPGTNSLLTLFTGGTAGSGRNNAIFTSVDSSRLFLGHSSTARSANVYNLSNSSLTTLTGTNPSPGTGCSLQDPVTGLVVFCSAVATNFNNVFTWDPSAGLSVIVGAYSEVPLYSARTLGIDSVRKYIVIGSLEDPVPAYIYSYASGASASSGSSVRKATAQGQPAGLLTLTPNSGTLTYKASEVDAARNVYLVNTTNNTIDRYTYSSGTSTYTLGGTMTSSATVINAITALAIDPNTAGFSILNGSTKKVYVFSDRSASGAISPASNFDVTEATTPTGLAVDRRNGDYYVVDSTVTSSAIKVRRYTNAGVYKGTAYDLSIDVSAASLGTSAATGETNFKIKLDELRNVLYLAAPTLNRLYVLSIPEPAA